MQKTIQDLNETLETIYISIFFSPSFSLSPHSFSLFHHPSLSISLSPLLSFSLYHYSFLSLPLFSSFFLLLFPTLSLPPFVSISFSLSHHPPLSLHLSLSFSLCNLCHHLFSCIEDYSLAIRNVIFILEMELPRQNSGSWEVFLLLDRWPYQDKRNQSALLFIHS